MVRAIAGKLKFLLRARCKLYTTHTNFCREDNRNELIGRNKRRGRL